MVFSQQLVQSRVLALSEASVEIDVGHTIFMKVILYTAMFSFPSVGGQPLDYRGSIVG